jgi:hypothetical protein
VTDRLLRRDVQPGVGDNGGDGHRAPPSALPKDRHVRRDTKILPVFPKPEGISSKISNSAEHPLTGR